jgi:hypothetical protein
MLIIEEKAIKVYTIIVLLLLIVSVSLNFYQSSQKMQLDDSKNEQRDVELPSILDSGSFKNYQEDKGFGEVVLKNISPLPLESDELKIYLNKRFHSQGCEEGKTIESDALCTMKFYGTCRVDYTIEVKYGEEVVLRKGCNSF